MPPKHTFASEAVANAPTSENAEVIELSTKRTARLAQIALRGTINRHFLHEINQAVDERSLYARASFYVICLSEPTFRDPRQLLVRAVEHHGTYERELRIVEMRTARNAKPYGHQPLPKNHDYQYAISLGTADSLPEQPKASLEVLGRPRGETVIDLHELGGLVLALNEQPDVEQLLETLDSIRTRIES